MRPVLRFLSKFLFASLFLFIIWKPIATFYLSTVTAAINLVGDFTGRPVRYVREDGGWWLSYSFRPDEFRLFIGNSDVPCLNLIVFIALTVASGFGTWQRLFRRLGAGISILWLSHLVHFWLLPKLAIWQYLWSAAGQEGGLPSHLNDIAVSAQTIGTSEQALFLYHGLASWRNIGMWGLAFTVWVIFRDRSKVPSAAAAED